MVYRYLWRGFRLSITKQLKTAAPTQVNCLRSAHQNKHGRPLALIQEPQFREHFVEEAKAMEIADHLRQMMTTSRFALPCSMTFWMDTEARPDYAQSPEISLAGLAAKAGEHPAET